MKKITISLIFLGVILSTNGQDVKRENIKLLFSLMHQDSLINKMVQAMTSSIQSQMKAVFSDSIYTNSSLDMSEEMSKLANELMELSKQNAHKLLNEDMVDIYNRHFTNEEIKDFITFYKSASGQTLLNKLPNITKDVMDVMQTKYSSSLTDLMKKKIDEISHKVQHEKK